VLQFLISTGTGASKGMYKLGAATKN